MRAQAMTLSTCRRSRTYWNASAWLLRGVRARDAEHRAVAARDAQPGGSHLSADVERDAAAPPAAAARRARRGVPVSAGALRQRSLVARGRAASSPGGHDARRVRRATAHDLPRRAELPEVVRGVVAERGEPVVGGRVARRRGVEVQLGVGAPAAAEGLDARPPGCPSPCGRRRTRGPRGRTARSASAGSAPSRRAPWPGRSGRRPPPRAVSAGRATQVAARASSRRV